VSQLSLYAPGSGGREDLQTRLLHRKDDPETSRHAASRTARTITQGQRDALILLRRFGPGTCLELAQRAAAFGGTDRTALYHQLARRLPELQPEMADVLRHDGRDVTRNGGRVWAAQ
jgi:hypothetical protein